MRLSAALLDRLDRDQVQRIHSGADRASREDRRSTTHPMELTFLASGRGDRAERRAPNDTDPSRGALVAARAAVSGGNLGSPEPFGEGVSPASPAVGGERLGTASGSPGVGIRNAAPGADHRASARVTTARPDVTLGPVAVEALRKARPNDDVDSDQEVATAVRSLVHASTAGGLAGQGSGGSGGGGDPGAGGVAGPGSHPLPLGNGDGDWLDLDTTDPRLVPYFRRVHAKVEPLWADAFPRSAMLDLKQGTVILEFTISPDGTARVSWPPARPSGIDEFDRNCANAIRKASPFDPVPRELGRVSLRIRAPFVAVNPIVR
jgi:TonB family protein